MAEQLEAFDSALNEADNIPVEFTLDGVTYRCGPVMTGRSLRALSDRDAAFALTFIESMLDEPSLEAWLKVADDLPIATLDAITSALLRHYTAMSAGKQSGSPQS